MLKRKLIHPVGNRAGACLGILAFLVAASTASATIIIGDPADYESRRQQIEGGTPTVSAGAGDAEEFRVFAESQGGFLLDEGRPILQFDLSALSAVPASATLSVELLSGSSNLPFAIELWGGEAARSAPLAVDDSGSAGEFASAGYEPAQGAGEVLIDDGDEPGRYFADVSEYLQARYNEYLTDGNSWLFFRLQPQNDWSVGEGISAGFTFASANHATEEYRPSIEAVPIPEPARAAWLFSICAVAFALVRGRLKKRRG